MRCKGIPSSDSAGVARRQLCVVVASVDCCCIPQLYVQHQNASHATIPMPIVTQMHATKPMVKGELQVLNTM